MASSAPENVAYGVEFPARDMERSVMDDMTYGGTFSAREIASSGAFSARDYVEQMAQRAETPAARNDNFVLPTTLAQAEEAMLGTAGFQKTKLGDNDKEIGYQMSRVRLRYIVGIVLVLILAGYSVTRNSLRVAQKHKTALLGEVQHEHAEIGKHHIHIVRIASLLDSHFKRVRQNQRHFDLFASELAAAFRKHKKQQQVILAEKLPSIDAQIARPLRKALKQAAKTYNDEAHALSVRFGKSIHDETLAAERKLKALTAEVMEELKDDTAEETRTQEIDKQWAQIDSTERLHAQTNDELTKRHRQLTQMAQGIKQKLATAAAIDATDFGRDGEQVRKRALKSARALIQAFESSQGQRPRQRRALTRVENDIRRFLHKHQPDYEEIQGVGPSEDLLEWIRLHSERGQELGAEVKAWEAHKLSDEELLVDLERSVKDAEISASWLQGGESESSLHVLGRDANAGVADAHANAGPHMDTRTHSAADLDADMMDTSGRNGDQREVPVPVPDVDVDDPWADP